METSISNEQKVLDYISKFNTSTLYFNGLANGGEIKDNGDTETLIYKIIEATYYYCSTDSKGSVETLPDRNRSSLDIWRHAKLYRPEITIFEVMRAIYNLGTVERTVVGCFCNNIHRRVTHIKLGRGSWVFNGKNQEDEYGLLIADWKNIGKEA